jgi:hypothetical protein
MWILLDISEKDEPIPEAAWMFGEVMFGGY